MKILKSDTISPFGGYNFIIEELDKQGVDKLLLKNLPALALQSKYGWKDLIYNLWGIYFCGGDSIEDLSINLKGAYGNNPRIKSPSPDRVLDRLKELAMPVSRFTTPRGKRIVHEFGINDQLNRLNIKLIKKLKLLKTTDLVLDYDNTILYTRKEDAAMTYKKEFGYCPGVGIIGNKIIYVENRNGNSAAANLQEDTLERMFLLLKEQNIKVDKFRADGASYKLSILSMLRKNTNKIYIRANMSEPLIKAITNIKNWKKISIDGEIANRGSIEFTPFISIAKRNNQMELLSSYRLVVTKIKRIDGQSNLFSKEPYNYHAILTNDHAMTNDEVVFFYNQRGAIEKEFDVLKNDFGWKRLPFSKLENNTVFLILTAMCRNIYSFIIQTFATKSKFLSAHYRIKKFIFRFICIPAKWIRQSRQWKLRVYGEIAFKT